MSEDSNLYRLEGSDNKPGGLIIRKKASDHTFKKPQSSVLGLDKLAERKRRENSQEPTESRSKLDTKERKYRSYEEETPTHTGGVNFEAQKRLETRLKHQRLSAKEKHSRYHDRDRDRRKDRDRDRDRERSRSRDGIRQTPLRFKDEPQTPKFRTKVSFIIDIYGI